MNVAHYLELWLTPISILSTGVFGVIIYALMPEKLSRWLQSAVVMGMAAVSLFLADMFVILAHVVPGRPGGLTLTSSSWVFALGLGASLLSMTSILAAIADRSVRLAAMCLVPMSFAAFLILVLALRPTTILHGLMNLLAG